MDAIRLSVIVFLLGAKYDQIPAQQGDRYAGRQLRQVQQAGDQAGSRDDDPNLAQGLVNLFLVQFHYYRSIALLAWSRFLLVSVPGYLQMCFCPVPRLPGNRFRGSTTYPGLFYLPWVDDLKTCRDKWVCVPCGDAHPIGGSRCSNVSVSRTD